MRKLHIAAGTRPMFRVCALLCVISLMLGGCSTFNTSTSDLFSLPRLAGFVTELQTEIDKVLAEGGEYSAPTGGTNRQSIQMEDLDGDGSEEAILFVRTSEGLKICVFHQDTSGGYSLITEVESDGVSFDSVGYVDLVGDGRKEMLIGISLGSGIPKALSVIILSEDGPREMLTATYTGYTQLDIDGDGSSELIIARHDAEYLSGYAEVYRYSADSGSLRMEDSVPLSERLTALRRMKTGYLRDGAPAVFITGLTSADGTDRMITDVCAYRDGSLENITFNPETGQSVELVPNVSSGTSNGVNGTDIDGDGVFDLPMPVILANSSDAVYRKIVWRNYALDGTPTEVMQTFHNTTDGWYFILPDSWKDISLAVDRRSSTSDERVTTFSMVTAEGETVPLVEIYAITGDNREIRSTLPGRFVVSGAQGRAAASTLYAAKLNNLADTAFEKYLPTEQQVADSFKFIQTEWLTGELTS